MGGGCTIVALDAHMYRYIFFVARAYVLACHLASPSSLIDAHRYRYFVTRTQAIARRLGRTSIVWDEIWNAFGTRLDSNWTVINTRFNAGQAPARTPCVANATSHGYRVVRSQNIHW